MTWPEYLAGCCRIDGGLTRLRFQEADVLCLLLLTHPFDTIRRGDLVSAIWENPDLEPGDAEGRVKDIISHLRRRGVEIDCVPRFGYRITREARGHIEPLKLAA